MLKLHSTIANISAHCIDLQIRVKTAHNVALIKRDVSPPVYHTLSPRRTPLITVIKEARFNAVRLCSRLLADVLPTQF